MIRLKNLIRSDCDTFPGHRPDRVTHRVTHRATGWSLICIASMAGAAISAPASAADPAELEVIVKGFRNGTGQAGCQIFASANGFPRNNEQSLAGVFAPIASGTARCVFKNLPAGSYAVSVMHDENSNKKLDSNVLGIPSEGYGSSNNRTYAMSPPKWEESNFELTESKRMSISVQLRY